MQVDHFSDPNASARIIRPLTAPADAAPSPDASARPKPSADRVEHRFLGVRRMMVEIETVVWLDRRNQRRKARQIGERMICADGKLWTISPDGVSRAPQSRTLGALYVHLDECRDDASFPNPVIEAAGRNLDRASVRGMSCRTTVSKQQFDAAVKHGQAMNVHPRRKRGLRAKLRSMTSTCRDIGSKASTRPVSPAAAAKVSDVSPKQAPRSSTLSPGSTAMRMPSRSKTYCCSKKSAQMFSGHASMVMSPIRYNWVPKAGSSPGPTMHAVACGCDSRGLSVSDGRLT